MQLEINLHLRLKKKHPCGGEDFVVTRLGSDVKIRCLQCSRELLLPRVKLEKMVKEVYADKNETT